MKNESAARLAHVATTTKTSRKPLPKYLFLRSGIYYFKRKVPQGLSHAFPEAKGGQVWKSLGTDLLEQARPPLAAEVSEFELALAKARRVLALSRVAAADGSNPHVTVQNLAAANSVTAAEQAPRCLLLHNGIYYLKRKIPVGTAGAFLQIAKATRERLQE